MPADNTPYFLILGGTVLLALGAIITAFYFYRRRCLIDDTPTSKTQGVFIGLAEIKGTAESDSPLTSYLASVRCVYYRYRVEEHWRRTSVDAKGRPKTESGWKTVNQRTESVPIFLKDDSGVLRVIPEGAEIHAENVFKQECRRDDPLYYEKGPEASIANSTHRRRFTEEAIPLHQPIYVIGQARERHDVVAAEIAQGDKGTMFLISTRNEKHHSDRYRLWFIIWLIIGLLVTVGGILLFQNQGNNPVTTAVPVFAGAGIYFLATIVGWVWNAYNSLVYLRQRVNQGWSQIEVELKRRHDLIPNLVEAVEGYRNHERATQELIAGLRREDRADTDAPEGLHSLKRSLLAVAEKYPELKADRSFQSLQKALTDTEQRLALARDYYNEIATYYRTRLEIIPDRWLGRLAGFKPRALLVAQDFERAEVRVNLAD